MAFGLVGVSADLKLLFEKLYLPISNDSQIGSEEANFAFINALLDLEKPIKAYKKLDNKKEPTEQELDLFFFTSRLWW